MRCIRWWILVTSAETTRSRSIQSRAVVAEVWAFIHRATWVAVGIPGHTYFSHANGKYGMDYRDGAPEIREPVVWVLMRLGGNAPRSLSARRLSAHGNYWLGYGGEGEGVAGYPLPQSGSS